MVRIDCEALARSVVGGDVVQFDQKMIRRIDREIKDDRKNLIGGQKMIGRSIGSCLRSATKANDKIPGAAAIFRQTWNEQQVH